MADRTAARPDYMRRQILNQQCGSRRPDQISEMRL